MAIAPQLKMDLRNAQQMVMSPQLSQAIAMLQMNNLELADYVDEQLGQNPFLERDKKAGETNRDASVESLSAQPNDVRDAMNKAPEKVEKIDPVATDGVYQEGDHGFSSDSMAGVGSGGRSDFSNDTRAFDENITTTKTLRDHLLEQVAQSFADPRDQGVAGWLVDYLDERGYLPYDDDELMNKIGVKRGRLITVMEEIRGFDPAGIFARDLKDCLTLQLEDRGEMDEAWALLLCNLDMVAEHELSKLAKICGLDTNQLSDRLKALRTLNPKPANAFDHIVVQTALPDVMMKRMPKSEGGGWRVELNHDTLPKVLINEIYVNEIKQAGKADKETKTFVSEHINNANWLIRAMDQRAQTVLAIASEVIEAQQGFFLYGVEFLKTMTLKDIAEEVEVHESTVSRIVNGKFIATPRGLFELKFFFSSGVSNSDGQDVASEAVKSKIKTLIDAEDSKKILSDDTLTAMLKKDGINIARRTVAKYREAMNYPSSVIRRRQKNS